jgi:NAD(P)-dependent dehydrogenase (short-subunit alcohol dehydrogenase family)
MTTAATSFAHDSVETAEGRFGGLEVAFNDAGSLGEMGPTPDVSLSGWNEAIEINSPTRSSPRSTSCPRCCGAAAAR